MNTFDMAVSRLVCPDNHAIRLNHPPATQDSEEDFLPFNNAVFLKLNANQYAGYGSENWQVFDSLDEAGDFPSSGWQGIRRAGIKFMPPISDWLKPCRTASHMEIFTPPGMPVKSNSGGSFLSSNAHDFNLARFLFDRMCGGDAGFFTRQRPPA